MTIMCGVIGIFGTIISIAIGFSDKEKLPNKDWYVQIESVNDIIYHKSVFVQYDDTYYAVRYGDNGYLKIDKEIYSMISGNKKYDKEEVNYTDIYIVFDENGKPLLCYPISNYKYVGKNLR